MDETTERAVIRDLLAADYGWTRRQREVLDLVVRGRSNQEVADALGISLDGAKWHMREILSKLGVDSREEAAEYWRRYNGLTPRFARLLRATTVAVARKRVVAGLVGGVAVVVAAVVVIVVTLNDGDGDPGPLASASPTIEATPAPTEVTPVLTPTTAPTTPGGWGDALAVYSFTEAVGGAARYVAVFDPVAGREVARWQFGSEDDPPVVAVLAGRDVVTVTRHRAEVWSLDGVVTRVLFDVADLPADSRPEAAGAAVSLDGTLAAITSRAPGDCPPNCAGAVRIYDLATGRLVAEAADALAAAGYDGVPADPRWHADGSGVLVRGSVQRDGHGTLATVTLDGSVLMHEALGWVEVSPGARYLAEHQSLPGLCIQSNPLVISEPLTGREVARLDGAGERYRGFAWAPDGSALLVRVYREATGCSETVVGTVLLHLPTGATEPVVDEDALLDTWQRPRLLLDCDGVPGTNWRAAGGLLFEGCADSVNGEILLHGQPVGAGQDAYALGLVPRE